MQQNDSTLHVGRVSSPASTGGTGTFFEQYVDAYWLALLLVRAVPPILIDCWVKEVCVQTEHLGWHTDDFLIIGESGSGSERKLAGQVKRTFTVSATDEECKKAIGDFWRDFVGDAVFSPAHDRFALVTQRGTNTLLEHFAGLLDCARASRDGSEFEHRLTTEGFISKKAVHYCDELRTIIGEIEGRSVTATELWPFLRVLHVLSLDLNTSTGQHEAMIKSLLAYTMSSVDTTGATDDSWSALLGIAANAMGNARCCKQIDLPGELRLRHASVGGAERAALQALKDHTDPILRNIRSTIGGDFHLQRAGLVQRVFDSLESAQVVLVSGRAGSGKSAIAKDAIALLSGDYFAFGFRAEEFAQPHLDATLLKAQVPVTGAKLRAILAGQDRKVLLVESVERLLEKSTRDAFSDLLTLATEDKSLRILLTCREYSTDLVRTSFLGAINIGHRVVHVPPLDDAELADVEKSMPILARPLASAGLRDVLRNPYILDKALQISWSADRSLPESEREFRAIFWSQIVRASTHTADGMPQRREAAFEQVAVRRARALAPYVVCSDLDPTVIDRLRQDSLIVASDQVAMLVAPAHDVLEDWAILQWIQKENLGSGGSLLALSQAIGTHPAVRRAYRKWVAEIIEQDVASTDQLFMSALTETGISAQFRDDTIVSILRAPCSPSFLEGHVVDLLANESSLLKRVIHLLRVACVMPSRLLSGLATQGSLFNVPEGPAWASVLKVVSKNIFEFGAPDRLLLLGLIEDWARGVNFTTPYPDGYESVAAIAHALLPHLDTYRSESAGQRTLRVIARAPNADPERFLALLKRSAESKDRNRTVDAFRDIIFMGLDGAPAARDMPTSFILEAVDYLLCSESDLRSDRHVGSSMALEVLFGIRERRSHGYFPASAYHGPWIVLLRYHPVEGLNFFLTVFNHSAEWYAHPRVHERIEPPSEIGLTFSDGSTRIQWGNPRMWNWYRGTSVGPYSLQSLLMALERWLLEVAETYASELDAILLSILKRSDSIALTSVVASVATAFPHTSGETLLVLLRSSECIHLDRQRVAGESHSPSRFAGMLGFSSADNMVHNSERAEADSLPHRKQDLETAIMNLQIGPLVTRVHEILDQHRGALPPLAEQDEADRIWRLAMHRMDLRRYSITEVEVTNPASTSEEGPADLRRQVRLDPTDPEPDVKAMMNESAAAMISMNARVNVLMWALKVFRQEDTDSNDPTRWREFLVNARSLAANGSEDDEFNIYRGGPGVVAAVCVRDHWQELSDDEQGWCLEIVCYEVMRTANAWDQTSRVQRYDMAPDRSCASVISLLVGKTLDDALRQRVEQAFVSALTHPTDEVRWYAVWGVAKLWDADRELVIACMNALAAEAVRVDEQWEIEQKHPYNQRRPMEEIAIAAASFIRDNFWQDETIPRDAFSMLDSDDCFGAEAHLRILAILSLAPTEPIAIAGFVQAAQGLVANWNSGHDNNRLTSTGSSRRHRERNFENESSVSQILQNFLMRVSDDEAKTILKPICEAVDNHPREIHWIVQGLVSAEDSNQNTSHFWFLWTLFAESIKRAKWAERLEDDHPHGGELIHAIFLGVPWKETTRHWKSLVGYAAHVHFLFEELPPTSIVLDDYIRFLYHVGEQSLPLAFVGVAKRLQCGSFRAMLKKSNTVFMLEVLLQRYVYGRPLELKSNTLIRDAVLLLLDLLVENGSSAAFRMRDDFVTPASSS